MRLLQTLRIGRYGTTRRKLVANASGVVDALEPRVLLSAVNMADEEQLMLELINRARANPEAEASRYGIDLNQGLPANTISSTPKQPLAPNQTLVNTAVAHSLDMINRDFFDQVNPNLQTPKSRATAAGYRWQELEENINFQGYTGTPNSATQVLLSHRTLFEDPTYREHMLLGYLEEAGIGIRNGDFAPAGGNATLVTGDLGRRSLNPIITGIVYRDANSSDFYDVGESIRSGTVTARNIQTGAVYSESIGVSGGYGIIVPTGVYSVTARYSLGNLAQSSTAIVSVGTENVKLDFDATTPESISLAVSSSVTSLNESGAKTTSAFTVTRNGSTGFPLTLSLSSSDTTEAVAPATIVIPAGQSSAQFTVTAVNDLIIDGTQTARITASANGYTSGSLVVTVADWNSPLLPSGEQIVTVARPTITWTGVSNAATYEIWMNNVTNGMTRVVNVSGIKTTSFTPGIDLTIGTYNVWVRGFTATGLPGLWSPMAVWKVRPTTTVLNSGRTERSSSFDIAWTPIPGAASYDIWVNRLTSQTSQYFRNTSVPGTSITVSNFAIGKYAVWVRARNSRGDLVGWSSAAIIHVNIAVPGVRVTATSLTGSATLNWTAVGGGSRYDVWVDNLTTRTSPVIRNASVAGSGLSMTTLTPGSYRAWVRAKDVNGTAYSWSDAFDFEFRQAPRMLTPPSSAQVPQPLFTWTAVSGATRYELIIADADLNPVISESQLSDTFYTPFINLAAGSYRAWVKAFDAIGGASAPSSVISFSVADATPSQPLFAIDGELELVFASIDQWLSDETVANPPDRHSRVRADARVSEMKSRSESGDLLFASGLPPMAWT